MDVFALRTAGTEGTEETKGTDVSSVTPYASMEIVEIPSPNPPRYSADWLALRVRSLRHPAAPFYRREAERRLVAMIAAKKPDLIVWGMSWMLPYAAAVPHIPGVVDEQNYDPLITARMARGRRGLEALKWRAYLEITARAERRNLRRVRGIAACSQEDAAIFRREAPHADVQVVPNGVDADWFSHTPRPTSHAPTVVMTGSYNYLPNAEGAKRLARRIWPLVTREVPSAELRLVGLNGETELSELAGLPGVTVVGTVPDIRPELERATVAAAPIDAGGGTRIKILEAFAAERPVVSTTIGAEGLAVTDGREALLRDDDAGFATALVQLLKDPEQSARMGRAGRSLVQQRYDWRASADALDALLSRVAGQSGVGSRQSADGSRQ